MVNATLKDMEKTVATLCLAERGDKILLGFKKRSFGAGRWNGFGGKVLEGENIEATARREFKEESGLNAVTMHKVGVLDFDSPEKFHMEVHVFRVTEFSGEPEETEEMRPQWFARTDVPYDEMWPDDRYWLPLFFEGKRFEGSFRFGEGDKVLDYSIREMAELH